MHCDSTLNIKEVVRERTVSRVKHAQNNLQHERCWWLGELPGWMMKCLQSVTKERARSFKNSQIYKATVGAWLTTLPSFLTLYLYHKTYHLQKVHPLWEDPHHWKIKQEPNRERFHTIWYVDAMLFKTATTKKNNSCTVHAN